MSPAVHSPEDHRLRDRILELADRCVKCGLCLPHCPTYRASLDESESPRGRIALLQGLAGGPLQDSPTLRTHLDHCLDCRSCERVCPAGVEYETLLDTGRQWLAQRRRAPLAERIGLALLARPRHLARLNNLLWLYQKSGLERLLRLAGLSRLPGLRLSRLLPPLKPARHWRASLGPASGARGRVALFSGCLGDTLEQDTIAAARKVLMQLGYRVDVVPQQTCCGALAQHSGDADQALALARRNLAAFEPDQVEAILYTATGCGAQLVKYPELDWPTEPERQRARAFADKLMEITTFLGQVEWPADLPIKSSQARVAIHEPCSQRNGLRLPEPAAALLARIPGLQLVPLAGNDQCCGAAGSYMLREPQRAARLRETKLAAIQALQADVVVTTNPGCSLFLNAGLREPGQQGRVVHPVVVLAQALEGR